MKKFIKIISGKKAMIVGLTLTTICSILDTITSVRTGTAIDYTSMCVMFSMIAVWDACLKKEND